MTQRALALLAFMAALTVTNSLAYGGTLPEAAKKGDLVVVSRLLKKGTNPDARDSDGVTAGQTNFQLHVGFTQGDFKNINKWNKRGSGGSDAYKLSNGFSGGISIEYNISSSYGIAFDGTYQYFSSHLKTEFRGEHNENFGIKDFPIWEVHAVPLSIFGYKIKDLNPFRIKIGAGIGITWARYRELYLHYGAYWFEDIKYNFSGYAPLFRLKTQFEYQLSDNFSIVITPSYQYSKIKKLKLSSKENGKAYGSGDLLKDNFQNNIDLDLSGFSILLGIAF